MKFLLKNPELYEIGPQKKCFSYKLLLQFISYALLHSFMIYIICLYALSLLGVNQNDGRDIGFWICGMTVYGCCILLANFVLALHSKTYDIIYVVTLFLGPIAYFLFYWILNLVFIGDISYLFAANFGITIVWYAIAFCLIACFVLDKIR